MSRLLEATSLHVTLGDQPVLSDVSVTLDPGEVVALIGPNGSGKTTLLRALLGQASVQRIGSDVGVRWNGIDLGSWKQRDLARLIAYMPQNPTYEPGDRVGDVLRLGRTPHQGLLGLETDRDEKVVRAVALDLELTDLLDRPLDTLSGGQRQRVFLGRCLVQEPKAVLLDEPATFLDLRHQVELYRLLRRLATEQQLAVIMASHDLNLAATHADRILVLKQGRLLTSGPTSEVMTEAVMTTAFDLPMKRLDIDGRITIVPMD